MSGYNPIFLVILSLVIGFVIRWLLFKTGLIQSIRKVLRRVQDWFHVHQFLKVPEFNDAVQRNHFHRKVSLYLHSLPSLEDADFTNLVSGHDQNDIVLRLDPNQTIQDHFLGATLFWFEQKTQPDRISSFVLKIRKTDKRRILRQYLRHINTVAEEMENQRKRHLRLFMNVAAGEGSRGETRWRSVPFTHPATFETIAMEKDLKNRIKSDIESFLKAKQYYRKLGRAWKRSFLLYGASGTGKSSFVAAIANFLRYDVYDTLASSYLGVREHKLFAQVEDIFRQGASLSPAEISELMIANRNSPSRAIKSVIGALQSDGDGRKYAEMIGRQTGVDDVDVPSFGGDELFTVKDSRKFYGFFKKRNGRRTNYPKIQPLGP
ncbi:AAA-ATPase protein [Vigna angularis]|uniref:AAA-ATPase protein n=1 Tax=Phaseolus angularis TaxID=3914 RepID=A0A8T0JR32_PHAAN|nr:AAA-ATPase protein [Vigna angularis]